MGNFLTLTLKKWVLPGGVATALALTLAGAPEKWEAHTRWRELFRSAPETERWFMPGELGHEPGAAPGRLSDRAFLTRAMSGVGRFDDNQWAKQNRLIPRLDFSHNLARVFPPDLYAEHPEFFPEEQGVRIHPPAGAGWWQPDLGREDVAAYAAGAATDYFKANPSAVSFALGVNDGLIFGDSPETRALTVPVRWFRERPDYSNLVYTFMNRVAARTAKTFPDRYLGSLAYYWCEQAPDFPVDPHIIPFLTADRSQGYDKIFRAEDRALQKRWIEALRRGRNLKNDDGSLKQPVADRSAQTSDSPAPPLRAGIYDYIYGGGFLIPRQHPHLLAEHLRYTRRLGFTDYFAEVNPNWGLDGAQPWLVAQLLQDPEQSVNRLLDEYYRRYFKESARPMRRFFRRCEAQWLHQPGPTYWLKFFRNEHQASVFPPTVCRELRGWLDTAAKEAKTPVVQARVRQVSDAFGVTERFVAMQTARDQLNRSVLSGKAKPSEWWAALVGFQKARAEFVRYTQALQSSQPLLIAPFKLDDYVQDDPTVNTLVRLAAAGFAPAESEAGADEGTLPLLTALREPRREAIRNGTMSGALKPPRRLAELPYEVSLPDPWLSRVEPAEYFQTSVSGKEGARVLRLAGNRNTEVYQWNAVGKANLAVVGMKVRGHLTPGATVILVVGWLDAQQQRLGTSWQVLPTGDWPDWVELWQGGRVPEHAVWVGLSLNIANQEKGDWLEVKDFTLELKQGTETKGYLTGETEQ